MSRHLWVVSVLSASLIFPAHLVYAAAPVVLTDEELDQVYAAGSFNFDFGKSLGSSPAANPVGSVAGVTGVSAPLVTKSGSVQILSPLSSAKPSGPVAPASAEKPVNSVSDFLASPSLSNSSVAEAATLSNISLDSLAQTNLVNPVEPSAPPLSPVAPSPSEAPDVSSLVSSSASIFSDALSSAASVEKASASIALPTGGSVDLPSGTSAAASVVAPASVFHTLRRPVRGSPEGRRRGQRGS